MDAQEGVSWGGACPETASRRETRGEHRHKDALIWKGCKQYGDWFSCQTACRSSRPGLGRILRRRFPTNSNSIGDGPPG